MLACKAAVLKAADVALNKGDITLHLRLLRIAEKLP